MKNVNFATRDVCCSRNPKTSLKGIAILSAAIGFASQSAFGANLLVNPSFETNHNVHIVPQGWTRFAPPTAQAFGNYWVEGAVTPHTGTSYFKEWGACYNSTNNVAGIYQDFSSAPGSVYQANGWCYTRGTDLLGPDCYTWFEVAFLGASSNLLVLYKSDPFNAALGSDTWIQFQVTNACDISSAVSLGDPFFNTYAITGGVSQLTAPIGTTTVRFRYAYLQFASQGGSAYIDDCVLNQVSGPIPPVVNNLFPLNMIFVNPNDGLSFNVSSPSGFTINNNAIQVVANNSNVSAGLVFSGSASSKNVTWSGLQSNTTYTVSITATDSFGFSVSANTYFETTWVDTPPIMYLWEAEDFDFTNGMYINNPILCSTPGNPNCYFGKVGVEGVDEHALGIAPNHVYRPDDAIGTVASGDYSRKDHAVAGVLDYRIDPYVGGSWLNYTRDWPAGTYWALGRLSTDIGFNGQLTLSVVNPDTSTTDLGTFTINSGLGWSAFQNVYLRDTNNNIVAITLGGKQTLRVTSGGNLLANFFTLVAGQIDLPQLLNLYPTGSHPFEFTNALSFTVNSVGATFPANSIKVFLDGGDVSSSLTITGPASTKNVVFPYLQPNAIHTVLITATNSLGHGISISNRFDTFSETNYMVEAEDFDYGGGQYVDPWYPEAYSGQVSTEGIDFAHTAVIGEPYQYRPNGIPQELVQSEYIRTVFFGSFDYHLAFFGLTDWANYTRAYPSGAFYVYGRFAGSGECSMYLDQVTSGSGTTNQVTKRLGHFHNFGRGYQTHDWVPLTDDGLAAPAVVKLGGIGTLRLSSGTFNPNYLMFVPAGGISLKATRSGNNTLISFPTQRGVVYRVFYRTDIASGNWTLLTSVLGDGTVKSASDSSTDRQRFYKVVSP